MSERTVTVGEAAAALGISEKAVRRRIERNVLPSVLGPDKRRRVPVSALGISDTSAGAAAARPVAGEPPVAGVPGTVLLELHQRLETLAREAGALRQIEVIAGQEHSELLEARARIRELEAQLAERPARRRFWRR